MENSKVDVNKTELAAMRKWLDAAAVERKRLRLVEAELDYVKWALAAGVSAEVILKALVQPLQPRDGAK